MIQFFKNMLGKKVPTKRNQPTVKPHLEMLETREVPAAYISNGHLMLVGTTGNDVVSVNYNSTMDIRVSFNGTNQYFRRSELTANKMWFYGGLGSDYFSNNLSFMQSVAYGGAGNDTLIGDANVDWLYGEGDNDYINGYGGDDYLDGGYGQDTMYGGSGNDRMFAGYDYSFNHLVGDAGNDSMFGGYGQDAMYGSSGDDYLAGNSGDDFLFGEAGMDGLYGELGNDYLDGGDDWYMDYVVGGAGTDTCKVRKYDYFVGLEIMHY